MSRLYFRIYLALLGSLAVFALLAGLAWRTLAGFEPLGPKPAFFVEAAELLVPAPGTSPEVQARQLEHWRDLSGYDLAILQPDGRMVAQATDGGMTFPPWSEVKTWAHDWHGPFGAHAVQLTDGRWLVAARPHGERGWLPHSGLLAALFGLACAVGIAAYPVVRRLTHRLEALQAGVEAFGAGNLSARVAVSGRDEIARLALQFNQSAARIEDLMRANRLLLANASHELRSPLARLRMGIETLQGATQTATREELACNISELDQLIEEILLASRLDNQPRDAVPLEPVDLVGLAAEECALVNADLVVTQAAAIQIPGDPRLLRRLIRNLLENAKRYGGGTAIDVVLRATAQRAELEVLDRGPGVPAAERDRIFEPFYRLPGRRERDGSVGLGLSLVRQIAKRHGGTVVCLAREGGGSCFRVVLPAS